MRNNGGGGSRFSVGAALGASEGIASHVSSQKSKVNTPLSASQQKSSTSSLVHFSDLHKLADTRLQVQKGLPQQVPSSLEHAGLPKTQSWTTGFSTSISVTSSSPDSTRISTRFGGSRARISPQSCWPCSLRRFEPLGPLTWLSLKRALSERRRFNAFLRLNLPLLDLRRCNSRPPAHLRARPTMLS